MVHCLQIHRNRTSLLSGRHSALNGFKFCVLGKHLEFTKLCEAATHNGVSEWKPYIVRRRQQVAQIVLVHVFLYIHLHFSVETQETLH